MKLVVASVDYCPEELYDQAPFVIRLIRRMPEPARSDYWLGALDAPLKWNDGGLERSVSHVVVAARWVGTSIAPSIRRLPIGISYVTDQSLLGDETLSSEKFRYVAVGIVDEVEGR